MIPTTRNYFTPMRILIVDEMHDSLLPLLAETGAEADYRYDFGRKEAEEVIAGYEGLIIRSKFFIGEDFLDKARNLRFIARAGAGLDLIDVAACDRRGIRVFAANEANRVAVAEHLLGMVLSLFNHINTSGAEIRQHQWLREKNRGEELQGKTVGIVGYGNNGSEAAARFAAFGCRVLVYDKYKTGFGTGQIEEAGLEEIFRHADVFSLHIPLTGETRGWVDAAFLDRFEKAFYFCNVARGEIMHQGDLIAAIRAGKVLGACLDVLENEKLSTMTREQQQDFDLLKDHPRVILTPHVAGWTRESYRKINEVLCRKIAAFINGD